MPAGQTFLDRQDKAGSFAGVNIRSNKKPISNSDPGRSYCRLVFHQLSF